MFDDLLARGRHGAADKPAQSIAQYRDGDALTRKRRPMTPPSIPRQPTGDCHPFTRQSFAEQISPAFAIP